MSTFSRGTWKSIHALMRNFGWDRNLLQIWLCTRHSRKQGLCTGVHTHTHPYTGMQISAVDVCFWITACRGMKLSATGLTTCRQASRGLQIYLVGPAPCWGAELPAVPVPSRDSRAAAAPCSLRKREAARHTNSQVSSYM